MHVVLVTHFFPPGKRGGTEILTLGLARSLQAQGHAVQVICAEDWDTAPGYTVHPTDDLVEGIPVRRLRFNWMKAPDVFRYLYDNPEVETHLTDFLRESPPDVVHLTSCYSLSASAISAARRLQIPIVLSATDFWFICPRNTLLRSDDSLCTGPNGSWKCTRCMLSDAKAYRWPRKLLPERTVASLLQSAARFPLLTRQHGLRGMLGDWEQRSLFLSLALEDVDRIVTASHFLRELFVENLVPPEKIQFSAYGLDTSWAEGFETKTPSSDLRVGFIGQIVPPKGPDILIRALSSLRPDLPVRLKIYGDLTKSPAYGREVRQLASRDTRIELCGVFDNSLMGEVLSEIDVLTVPSTWYDFPLVIPSAFATKTPVLATDLPGMNELVKNGVNGMLFDRHDWAGLADRIRRLADNPGLLERLRSGIEPVKTLGQMTGEYVDLYRSLLLSRRETRSRRRT